mmetsp:Transcript_98460/g.234401  ORF Transcript_98460/g.234401 Transcript_98460/m.234401 type:complete len:265 (+) Transcript_98460:56-850(+)
MAAAEAFFFEVPDCPKGTILKLKAPDGKTLQIPLPQEAVPGDHMYLSKTEEGTWAFDKIIRHKYTKGAEDAAAIAMKTEEEVQKDLRGPETVQVQMDTTKGPIRLTIVPSWSPLGAQRALDMVRDGFWQDLAIYRGIKGFLVQFGVVDDEKKKAAYTPLPDDPLCGVPYLEGTVGFAAAGPNTRSCQLCLFLGAAPSLGRNSVETPIGRVAPESMETLHSLFLPGDIPQCGGKGPDPHKLAELGNAYIQDNFPECDFVTGASLI